LGKVYDIFVVGGGINGCGVARDASGRDYSVCLAEMNDLASGTSSWSSKLIHGGLRYLEHYEFRLVREALGEREVLLKSAPHIIWPMRFVLPHHKGLRPAWLLRLGLFLYDHIGKRKLLPGTTMVDLTRSVFGAPLKKIFSKGFEYSDCWVEDSRLVVLNAKDAENRGAEIRTRTKVLSAHREGGLWRIVTQNTETGATQEFEARLLVNAAGPWVDHVLGHTVRASNSKNVRLVQGSHIVVKKLFDHDRAYIFQNSDNRIIFAIPYEQNYTLIGTTDQDYSGDPSDVKISAQEETYLCNAASEYFEQPVRQEDIVWRYSGVRPLFDDGASEAQEATRDYVLRRDGGAGEAPLVNVFGGKLTTYRKLAESMMALIEADLGTKGAAWTVDGVLPGGDFDPLGYGALVDDVLQQHPYLEASLAARYVRLYGTKVWELLGSAKRLQDLGRDFGEGLTACEVTYLIENEWAQTAADVIWRRTKLGIRFTEEMTMALDRWMAERRSSDAKAVG
jgi:glycerol-3-phosphate dehydrogenase